MDFFLSGFLSSLNVLDISPLEDMGLVKNPFLLCRLHFCPIDSVLCLTEFALSCLKSCLKFHEVQFINCTIGVLFRKPFCLRISTTFSSIRYHVSGFVISWIHLDFSFVQCNRYGHV